MKLLTRASLFVTAVVLVFGLGCGDVPTALPDDVTEPVFRVVSGNNQIGVPGEELPDVLVAKLTDGNGNPRVGYVVNWVIIEGGGSVWAPATMTNDKGKTKNRWTLGPKPGTNVVEVRSMAPSGKKRKHGRFTAEGASEKSFELIDGVNIPMVWIPPGEFEMGSPLEETDRLDREGPVHTVTIGSGFWMSKYEVTQGQWEAVMGTNPAQDFGVGANHPVHTVDWYDIQDFLEQTTSDFRLPSEAEWEYAARAGTQTRFYWGDDPGYQEIGDYAVYSLNAPGGAAEVGTKKPNAWGLYDMSGNVNEWVEDDYHDNYVGAPIDGSAWLDVPHTWYRVLRGASWFHEPWQCRSAYRSGDPPGMGGIPISGFRVVLDP